MSNIGSNNAAVTCKYLKFMGEMEFSSFLLPPPFPKNSKKKAFKGH